MNNKQKTGKRWLAGLLSLTLVLCLVTPAFAAGFTDVPANAWYRGDVEYAVQNGLVNGTSPTTYSPDDNLTYAAAVKLAAAMHKKVTVGNTDFAAGSPWYQPYVDYAKANKIITKDYAWNSAATRAGYMEIFAGAIPDKGLLSNYRALEPINTVDDNAIPDVSAAHPQAAAIYKLYRAGIVQGTDAARSCAPDSAIKRSEVAAILTRMMDSTKRMAFAMSADANELVITQQPQSTSAALGGKCTLTVTVSGGKSPYAYQWYLSDDGTNWSPIVNSSKYSGVNTAALTIKADGSGSKYPVYRCIITDSGHKSVMTAIVNVAEEASALTITQQPKNAEAVQDEWVTFTTAADGGRVPYTYQWQMNQGGGWETIGSNAYFQDVTSASLKARITGQDLYYGIQYRCVVTDADGRSAVSDAAKVTERTSTVTRPTAPLAIAAQPQGVSAKVNDWVTFNVAVSGGKAPYTYQWQYSPDGGHNWGFIAGDGENYYRGSMTDALEVKVGMHEEEYAYRCLITDASGESVTSAAARVSVSGTPSRPSSTPLTITVQPQNAAAKEGDEVSFTVTVSGGTGSYTYQWQWSSRDGGDWVEFSGISAVSGQNTAVLSMTAGWAEDRYQYRCVISDGSNSVTSETVYIDLK